MAARTRRDGIRYTGRAESARASRSEEDRAAVRCRSLDRSAHQLAGSLGPLSPVLFAASAFHLPSQSSRAAAGLSALFERPTNATLRIDIGQFVLAKDRRIGYERHTNPVPTDPKARADRTDDRNGYFRKPSSYRGSRAVPGLRPSAPMEAGRSLGGRRSAARLLRLSPRLPLI